MWIYDQLHPQTETSTREIHDEQCSGELHHFTGMSYCTVGSSWTVWYLKYTGSKVTLGEEKITKHDYPEGGQLDFHCPVFSTF